MPHGRSVTRPSSRGRYVSARAADVYFFFSERTAAIRQNNGLKEKKTHFPAAN